MNNRRDDLPVVVREYGESFEHMVGRFIQSWKRSGIKQLLRDKEEFITKRERRILRAKRARRRENKGRR